MASLPWWPAVNAMLNGLSALLLLTGFFFIRRKNVHTHRFFMGAAFVTSTAFLVSYLAYHYQAGTTRFQGQGWVRALYFGILLSHTALAAIIVPLAVTTLARALRGRYQLHRRIARWTLPIWLYVSITGVVVYWMLYRLYPPR